MTNPRFSTRTTPWHSAKARYTTVTWVGQVTFDPEELSHMCPLCHGFCINFAHLHNLDLIGSDTKLSVQNRFKALRIQPNVDYSLDS